ncbi:hypothetical protein [Rhodobacter sp. 24-YEA-8]|uniref:hypothetical protein n=1 Tax=Rhodobacter sp. 24-YEA-8 TaxID=1884310 RepID=UPI00089A8CA3|nr:hypothetical protein [Rhodobacter sp. 24-YEA-8]SEC30220.1 hypothetical protein SAMN05519105_2322 [Rhodobacter sp. 24-YEA-8]
MRKILFPLLLATASPAFSQAALPEDAIAIAAFSVTFAEECTGAFSEDGRLLKPPKRFEVESPGSWGDPIPRVVWEFQCDIYAYNISQVFMISSDQGGAIPVGLTRPTLKIEYDEEAAAPGEADSVVSLLEINGWSADLLAINAGFDPQTLQISSHTFWRGIGDASDAGIWRLQDAAFRLVRYEVDASYDGESNPVTLVNFE